MKNPDNPAYPVYDPEVMNWHRGLTKREYFAAMAMQGYLASYANKVHIIFNEADVKRCVEYADNLLKQLES